MPAFCVFVYEQELFYKKLQHDEITILAPIYRISTIKLTFTWTYVNVFVLRIFL